MDRIGAMQRPNIPPASATVDYFAYGANLDERVLEQRQFDFLDRLPAVLRDFALRFNRRASRSGLPAGIGFANIVEQARAAVEGILYTVTFENLAILDQHERAPEHYRRHQLVVETSAGPCGCEVYRAHPDRVADDLVPPRNYLDHILAAKDLLSENYWIALSRQECYRAACEFCAELTEVLFVEANGVSQAHCTACGAAAP